jgi:glycosyltransferase involved in cell wall biosynthesis
MLRSARVFCLPTPRHESFGLSLLEAMSCGIACIASPHGGIKEVGGDAVVYVEPWKTDEFAGAIEWLLTDDAAARDLGIRARARAEHFSIQQQFEKLDDVVTRFA